MELVHIDYVGMEVTVATDKKPVVWNVLVVVDHFTHYVQAFITKNHMVRTMARVLYNNYFSVFGFPHVGSGNGILWEGHCCHVQPAGKRSVPPHITRKPTEWLREYTRLFNA